MTHKETRSAAHYFYSGFLGCDVPDSAKKQTRDYYQATRDFINSADVDSEQKIDLYNCLYTYLKMDQQDVISVAGFADNYLDDDLKATYTHYMAQEDIPANAIAKDLEYIKYSLKRRRVKFSSGVQILAPAAQFDELVSVVESAEDSTILRINGTISSQE